MSECRICRDNGHPGIMIAWDNNIRTKTGRFVPLEPDKTTPHKHYEANSTTTAATTTQPQQPTKEQIDSGAEVRKVLNETAAATTTTDETTTAKILDSLTEIKKLANTLVVAIDLLEQRIEHQNHQ